MAVVLWGEPGIGKTHLARAVLREAPCASISIRARQPLEQVALAVPRSPQAGAWLAVSIERLERGERFTGEQLVKVLAAQLALRAPVVLHVEDLHECSPDQLQLWRTLAARVTRTRGAGLLVTSRTLPQTALNRSTLIR
ncbi:ATP-binding protein [Deinococcus sonorensis]|uniref:ATP-binding protein n=1 Tax=Deinococcus sonorensis KR-87 TaxID=694439 RepID=A0AAU7U6K6_9DEIO